MSGRVFPSSAALILQVRHLHSMRVMFWSLSPGLLAYERDPTAHAG